MSILWHSSFCFSFVLYRPDALLQEQFERVLDDLALTGFFLIGRQVRVACGVRNGLRAGDTGCADGLGDRGNCADVSCRDAGLLDLLDDRCTATCTGPSGGGEDDALNAVGLQLLCDLLSESGGVCHGGGVAGGGDQIREYFSDLPFLLQLFEYVIGCDAVRVLVRVYGVVSRVDRLEFAGRKLVQAVKVVFLPELRGCRC